MIPPERPGGTAALAVLALAVFLTVIFVGWDRSFWFDEVFTLGAAAIGGEVDWQILLGDVHPPTYVLLVRWLGSYLGPDSHLVRLVNLPGLIALAAAFALIAKEIGWRRSALVAALGLGNGYALLMAVDLRSYFLVYGFTFLAHAVLLKQIRGGPAEFWLLLLTVAVLCSLHFFGAAIGLSVLAVSAVTFWRRGQTRPAMVTVAASAIMLTGLAYWIFGVSTLLDSAGGNLWIENSLDPWINFVLLQIPVLATGLIALIALRKGNAPGTDLQTAAIILAPAAMVCCAALAISLHTPVVSLRNLIVLTPGLVLFMSVVLPTSLLTSRGVSTLVGAAVVLVAARNFDVAARDQQAIRWATEAAAPAVCDGAPIHVLRQSIVDVYAQQVFLGEVRRPVRNLADFDPAATLPDGCRIIAMGFHEVGTLADLEALFDRRGVKVSVLPPPDTRLAERQALTHGFVVELRP